MAVHYLDRSRNDLWRGAILTTIAHAVTTAKYPNLAHEQSWDDNTCNLENTMGAYGSIAFSTDDVVAAFFDSESPRSPFQAAQNEYVPDRLFEGMPVRLKRLAEKQALPYLLQDYQGQTMPIITAAFWSIGNRLAATEPWSDVVANGAHLARIHLMNPDKAIEELRADSDLTSAQAQLIRSLFNRRIESPDARIVLTEEETKILLEGGDGGRRESRDLLSQIDVFLPSADDASHLAADGGA